MRDRGVRSDTCRRREISVRRHIAGLIRGRMSSGSTDGVAHPETDREVAQRRNGKVDGIADHHGARLERHRGASAEREGAIGRASDRRTRVSYGNVRGPDDQRPLPVLIRQPDPHAIAAERRANDLPNGAIDIRWHAVH